MTPVQSIPTALRDDPVTDVSESLEDLKERASELELKARTFIRENPTLAVAGAVAVGFLIGRLVTR